MINLKNARKVPSKAGYPALASEDTQGFLNHFSSRTKVKGFEQLMIHQLFTVDYGKTNY